MLFASAITNAMTRVYVLQAFATAWAGGISCGPDCYVGVDDAAESIGSVVATASASAYSYVCAGAFCALLVT